jgi:thiamine-phosphate pyrophosphorylase
MTAHASGAERRARLKAARLYLVCDSTPGGRELADVLPAAIAGGVQVVQLRDKRLPEDELRAVACAARSLCQRLGALFVVNDHPVVALAAGADGVHVGQDDMPVAQVRELVGPDVLVGLSTHTPAEIDAAVEFDRTAMEFGHTAMEFGHTAMEFGHTAMEFDPATENGPSTAVGSASHRQATPREVRSPAHAVDSHAVDYIGVGPVHATPTKPGRPAVGLDLVLYAAAHARVPFFAIGGIDAGNAAAAIDAGARRVAVARAIAAAADPERATRALRAVLDGADERPRA